jgi:hypothetical protein
MAGSRAVGAWGARGWAVAAALGRPADGVAERGEPRELWTGVGDAEWDVSVRDLEARLA